MRGSFNMILLVLSVSSQLELGQLQIETCHCIDYWECLNRGGHPYSYCGIQETSVCCLTPALTEACGVKGLDSGRIEFAEPSEWPWHVAVVEDPGFYYRCGGSLVDESWVLTAAHCVQNGTLKVRLGEYDVSNNSEDLAHEDRNVSLVVIHPEYNENTLNADIALLRLESPAFRRPHIDVVCLPAEKKEIDEHSVCFVTGWGKTEKDGDFSHILKEIFIPVWNNTNCLEFLNATLGHVSQTSVCAGGAVKDTCTGDGGSPLVCQENGQWYQHGIVSYGFGCGENDRPGIYTKVSAFIPWIRKTILSPPGKV